MTISGRLEPPWVAPEPVTARRQPSRARPLQSARLPRPGLSGFLYPSPCYRPCRCPEDLPPVPGKMVDMGSWLARLRFEHRLLYEG